MAERQRTYAETGVNYAAMDPAKVNAQSVGRTTSHHLERFGYKEVEWSRGESVYLMEGPHNYLGFVVEGLGTKNLVSDVMWHLLGKTGYEKAAQDAVAMIVNDMITLGVLPMVVGQYLGVGSDRWFANPSRSSELAIGWGDACNDAGAVYGPGETPTLRDVIYPTAADIAGASMGMIRSKDMLINPANIRPGDIIITLASSGIHANGLTLVRDLADLVPYRERLSDGRMFGEAVLDPTPIYVPLIEALQDRGIIPHYTVNITGHGWRKLMRAQQPFVYRIVNVPAPQPIFSFIQSRYSVSLREMYANYNMGAGFALIVDPADAEAVLSAAGSFGYKATVAGAVLEERGRKAVEIAPLRLVFEEDDLAVR